MSDVTFKAGDLVYARFRPDNVGTVKRVYGKKCDLSRTSKPMLYKVPAKALVAVPDDMPLFAVATESFGHTWIEAIVAGVEGIESWCKHHPHQAEEAEVCRVSHKTFEQLTGYTPLADLLDNDQTEAALPAQVEAA